MTLNPRRQDLAARRGPSLPPPNSLAISEQPLQRRTREEAHFPLRGGRRQRFGAIPPPSPPSGCLQPQGYRQPLSHTPIGCLRPLRLSAMATALIWPCISSDGKVVGYGPCSAGLDEAGRRPRRPAQRSIVAFNMYSFNLADR